METSAINLKYVKTLISCSLPDLSQLTWTNPTDNNNIYIGYKSIRVSCIKGVSSSTAVCLINDVALGLIAYTPSLDKLYIQTDGVNAVFSVQNVNGEILRRTHAYTVSNESLFLGFAGATETNDNKVVLDDFSFSFIGLV